MTSRFFILAAVGAAAFASVAPPAVANPQRGSEQGEARRDLEAGAILKSREIEARVLPTMRDHQYLGFEYDPAARAYRLKFIRDSRVSFVDVDARTGRIIRRSN
ncbi:hypothetical protein EYB45_05595 [Erythrobacteraceae bacterium CFH 75059]|uniref:PepSY domain-containing protein n=1 Tax=Qipengyuania thermophila TaxID=2509361 RepID=UPI0010212C1E|nr:PepSY domain-containing protein [Qipengyuania thermophila]TCD04997.1 hypothetical protein EYB45_05595 [Erythrobacteraceae bacterium CFH 75059]